MTTEHRKIGPVLSVVDYDAWEKGYMPPSEHILIDQLAYRGARIMCSSSGGDFSYWLVIKGKLPPRQTRFTICRMLMEQLDLADEDASQAPQTPNDEAATPPRSDGEAEPSTDGGPDGLNSSEAA